MPLSSSSGILRNLIRRDSQHSSRLRGCIHITLVRDQSFRSPSHIDDLEAYEAPRWRLYTFCALHLLSASSRGYKVTNMIQTQVSSQGPPQYRQTNYAAVTTASTFHPGTSKAVPNTLLQQRISSSSSYDSSPSPWSPKPP